MDSIVEILSDLDKDISNIKKHATNNYLKIVLQHALDPSKKFNLPEGNPPFTPKSGLSHAEVKGSFWQEARKLATYTRKDVKAIRLETLYIQALESFDADTAKIFLAIKDQTLGDLYPNITIEALKTQGYAI